jgi:hippurate hydrolase
LFCQICGQLGAGFWSDVGAARLLSGLREQLSGSIRFMFQPGEEGSGGAAVMIEEGVLDGVDAAFATAHHVSRVRLEFNRITPEDNSNPADKAIAEWF